MSTSPALHQPPRTPREEWQRLIMASNLPPAARLVALALSVFTDDTAGQGVWFTAQDFGRVTGIESLTVIRHALNLLRDEHWITAGGKTAEKFLAWPGPRRVPDASAVIPHHHEQEDPASV